jgi:hypothetical protein
VLLASAATGASVAVLVAVINPTTAATPEPSLDVRVNVEVVMVSELIGSLNFAVMDSKTATPVLPFVGVTAVTVGGPGAAVVKDQL